MKTLQTIITALLIMTFMVMCVEPFNPPIENPPENYLVIDGFYNSGTGESTVRLIRTQALNDENPPIIETDAQVSIETEDNAIVFLNHQGEGVYTANGLDLNDQQRCRLHVRTSNGKEYQSDFVPVKNTPEIDSVTWKADDEGLHIYVNTHDPSGSTRYYRWDYVETFQYSSAFYSAYKYDPVLEEVVFRMEDEDNIYYCWSTNSSTGIFIGTSSRLTDDIISQHRIISLPPNSVKHSIKYSVLVRQHAITKEAYDYWQNLKRNTEEVGSIFGVQPSSIDGNIQCVTNLAEPVIGFFSVSSVTEKRIFVKAGELPFGLRETGYSLCQWSEVDTIKIEEIHNIPGGTLLIGAVVPPMGIEIIGYTAYTAGCIDCRLKYKGTNIKPSFWE